MGEVGVRGFPPGIPTALGELSAVDRSALLEEEPEVVEQEACNDTQGMWMSCHSGHSCSRASLHL